MRIALSGAQGTGKTTLFNELQQYVSDHNFIGSPSRAVGAITAINENGSEYSQELILAETIKRAFKTNTIQDRWVLDTLCYTTQLYNNDKLTLEFLNYNIQAVNDIAPLYDHIFYIAPEFDLIDDGTRSQSPEYRAEIVSLFEHYIKLYNIPVTRLTGSVEERVAQFLKSIGKLQ